MITITITITIYNNDNENDNDDDNDTINKLISSPGPFPRIILSKPWVGLAGDDSRPHNDRF